MRKILVAIFLLIIITPLLAMVYLRFFLPDVDVPAVEVDITPERIQHGKYLANHVTVCIDCHSTRDWSRFSGPLEVGSEGMGGQRFGKDEGFPGTFYSRNITPYNLENWTDGEIFRAITSGVDKDNKALFPVMPYLYYGTMDKEDVYDIIAYLRSLDPIENETKKHVISFPMVFLVNTIPKEPKFSKKPPTSDTVAYGGYLVKIAACMECHTPVKSGQIIPKKAFSGGRSFTSSKGILRSANITSDSLTGIGAWTEEAFVARFKAYDKPTREIDVMPENAVNTNMPWTMYGGMDSSDLVAIYRYLKTIKPIKNEVVHYKLAHHDVKDQH